jgi:hypothetical protein
VRVCVCVCACVCVCVCVCVCARARVEWATHQMTRQLPEHEPMACGDAIAQIPPDGVVVIVGLEDV